MMTPKANYEMNKLSLRRIVDSTKCERNGEFDAVLRLVGQPKTGSPINDGDKGFIAAAGFRDPDTDGDTNPAATFRDVMQMVGLNQRDELVYYICLNHSDGA